MNVITRRRFAIGALATGALLGRETHAQASSELHTQVLALPTGSADEKRKQAVLLWALEDAAAAQAAGMAEDAAAELADVAAALTQPILPPTPPRAGLFPAIATAKQNPWLDATLAKVRTLTAAGQTFPRGADPDAKDLGIKYTYPYIQLGQEGSLLAQAFGNPATGYYGQPELIAPMLRRFAASYEILTPGSKHLADFGVSPHIAEMYCLLKMSFPGLLLPSRQAAWEDALRRNADAILRNPGQAVGKPGMPTEPLEQMFEHPVPGDCYPNAQSHYMNALLFTGIALHDDRYLKLALDGVQLMATAFWPDGATAYISFQNECFTYHGIMIEDLARLWQVTGNALALQLVRASRWYYPLSITPQAVAEYSSAPCWKHYWNGVKGTSTAAIVASIERCGYNAQVGANDKPAAGWLPASLYVPVAAEPWWDNAITYDRNIEGPRGRFGSYSFCASARNTLQDDRPKLTYAGNMLLDRDAHGNPELNAALDGAWAEVRVNTRPETVNRWDTHACLSKDEVLGSLADEHFGALASRYRTTQYKRPPIAFEGRQQWLVTPQRLVGLFSLESLADQDAYSMGFAIKTVCGRGSSGTRREWVQRGPTVFEYGGLTIRLHPLGDPATDLVALGAVQTSYTDTFTAGIGKCGLLTLVDPAAAKLQQRSPTHYAKGTHYHAAVEIYPTSFGAAASLAQVEAPSGLVAFELREATQSLLLVHNPGLADAAFTPSAPAARLHRSGQAHRLAFLPAVPTVAPVAAQGPVAVPAGQHIVLRSA